MGKRQMRNRVFHQARVADMVFEGIMTGSGPTLSCQMNGSVALGVSGLRQFQLTAIGSRRPPPPDWWVVRLAKMYASYDPYLPRWYERAIIEAGALSAWSQPLRPLGKGTAWP